MLKEWLIRMVLTEESIPSSSDGVVIQLRNKDKTVVFLKDDCNSTTSKQ